ncbi:hypothetical protein WJX77_006756 [Trebouxia sp. C0004]
MMQVAAAQQYSVTLRGYPALQQWVKKHTWAMHSPPADHDVVITSGSNHTIEMIMSLLMDKGDTILSQFLKQHSNQSRPPRLLYTVPVGQNPTGVITPTLRRQQIYSICRQHDVIILEDDPYFYLQFAKDGTPPGLSALGESYLSLDVDGRVIRLDSFSEVLAPGLRLGWATAAPALLEKLIFHLHGSTLGPCAMSQVVVANLLQHWGEKGFEQHVKDMQQGYAQRALLLHKTAEEHLQGLAKWQQPQAGMFAWMKLCGGIKDADQILDKLKEEKVVVVPGRIAHCEGPRPSTDCPYIRVSFASATNADLVEGVKRLANVIRKFGADTAKEPEGKPHSNGNAVHLQVKANSSAGKQFGTHKPASAIVHENEQSMHLEDAVHSAADSQPEAC